MIGENTPDARLHAETLARCGWDPEDAPLLAGIEALVALHRLREVVRLYGFMRFESSPPMSDDGLEDVGLAVRGAPLGSDPDWLPAIEQFGEGLFIQLRAEAVEKWLARDPGTKPHTRRMLAAYAEWAQNKPAVKPRRAMPENG